MAKIDARVRYTKKVIKDSFLKILKTKPVNKITVKEVCDLAEINRATFYSHYYDCFDLMDRIEDEIIDVFKKSLTHIEEFNTSALIGAIYNMVEQNREACDVLIFRGASPSILNHMISLAKDTSISVWEKQLSKASKDELEMLYMHLSNGLVSVVLYGYDKYDKDDIKSFVDRIARNSLSLFK